MLPGFRFLFAAVMVSMSILIFGLGAAALLRAAHEEVASNPMWRSAPVTIFAQPSEAASPVLALLRVEPPAEPRAPDNVPAAAAPVGAAADELQGPDLAVSAPEPDKVAALQPEESPPPEPAKPEIPASAPPAPQSEAEPAQPDAPAATGETKIAATTPELTEPVSSPADPDATTAHAPMTAPALPGTKAASTKVAALGHARAKVETARHAKTASAKHDTTVKRDTSAEAKEKEKRLQELRAKRRRLAAARARTARQQAEQLQPANPFAPFIQPATQPAAQPATR